MVRDYPKKVVEAVKSGIHLPFWTKGVKWILEDEVNNLSEQILEDGKGDRLTDEKRNHLIDLRLIVKNLLSEIEGMVKEDKENKEDNNKTDDPYE